MKNPVISLDSITKTSHIYSRQQHKLRASTYVIYVDLPNNKDEVLLVHGYTGAYDLVSQEIASYVRSFYQGCCCLIDHYPDRVELVMLPTYSPQLNPVERFWKHLRCKVTRNAFSRLWVGNLIRSLRFSRI